MCKVYSFLKKASKVKHAVDVYHASLSELHKTFVQSAFQSTTSEIRCLVALPLGWYVRNGEESVSSCT